MKSVVLLLLCAAMPAFAQEQATSDGAFLDSIGVNTHLSYTNSSYANFPMVLQALKGLGVHHIRDGFYAWPAGLNYYTQFQQMKAAGISLDAVVQVTSSTTPQQIDTFCALATNCEALEYPNEVDAGSVPTTTWQPEIVAMQPTIQAAASALKLPVYGPSFTQAASYAAAGNMAGAMTYSNLHIYFGGRNPESTGWGSSDAKGNGYGSIAWWQDNAATYGPGLPVVVTETGYLQPGCAPPINAPALKTAVAGAGPCAQYPDPQTVPYALNAAWSGAYTLRTLFALWNAGIKRSYLYELIDDPSSPNYGLLFANGDTKRSYQDLGSLTYLLNDGVNPNIASEHGSLTYTLTGQTANLQHTLLQRRDGVFFLALWLGVPDANPVTGAPIPVVAQPVTLALPANTVQEVYTFRPGLQYATTAPGAQAAYPKSYMLSISDQVTLLRIGK